MSINVLITSSRMPFALEEIRKFGRQGHRVFAADTFRTAPGNHSRFVTQRLLTPSPRHETQAFIDCLAELIVRHEIDLLVPAFEESLYIARHIDRLGELTRVFVPPFETLLQLHDKARFVELAASLGVPVPRTVIATSPRELRAALKEFDHYLARPAFSRGGIKLLTNSGPLAGEFDVDDAAPSHEHPWLVQEFIEGEELCTFSVAHDGCIAAHSAYVHPREIEHGGGIVFNSVENRRALEYSRTIIEATGYTGQIHFDFLATEDGRLYAIECNPRATNGCAVMDDKKFVDAVLEGPGEEEYIAPPGTDRKISIALIRDMLLHWDEAAEDLEHLLSDARDIYIDRDDLMPGLFQVLSYSHVVKYRNRHKGQTDAKRDLMAAYFDDIEYNDGRLGAAPDQQVA